MFNHTQRFRDTPSEARGVLVINNYYRGVYFIFYYLVNYIMNRIRDVGGIVMDKMLKLLKQANLIISKTFISSYR